MNRAIVLAIGLLTILMFLAASCGDAATSTPRSQARATNTPVATTAPIATTVPATVAPAPTEVPATSPPEATATPTEAPAPAASILDISVNGDALEFNESSFSVSTGSQVTLTFNNVSTAFQHNWVLTLDGTKDDVATRGTLHSTSDWVQPDDPDVIYNTKLLDPGATGSVTFAAPAPGTYQFVCTFPGHNITMFGTFEVSG